MRTILLPHVSVCICTYRRERMLERLLRKVAVQNTNDQFTFSVVISDNDAEGSARLIVERVQKETGLRIEYFIQKEKNIALARNTAVLNARGEFIAFIDDDEFPEPHWLLELFKVIEAHNVSGVLAPVIPHFEPPPPNWILTGKFYQRPRHKTGFRLDWPECRTGNVLLRTAAVCGLTHPFDPQFGTGGEDQDFFRRLAEKGHNFLWCDEAFVFEEVPPTRLRISFLLKRALLRGRDSMRHRETRWRNLSKSLIALPVYTLLLPILLIIDFGRFMKFSVKLADHAGRILTVLGLSVVRQRPM